jgi:hypothetical protein
MLPMAIIRQSDVIAMRRHFAFGPPIGVSKVEKRGTEEIRNYIISNRDLIIASWS